ncbi:hypothetical protein F0P96_05980 [Hymenobacter busanensis]|uniref:Uncharacterized protein n=1 Tax=Hymenobacter busanensis TaxID=2607656 RepID=A0A7L5A3P7_9BACT|nr:hypothetical protein [Hymenobacter busanensis]KAA9338381.1 hypothetical protein F0P96_05980 [Hymenobacter busanensis]QHJ09192.1 hypothetical protein GUY19_18625 [Hymenobacter busanensis]
MKPAVDPLAQLTEIRSIMERSSRFISLSGLSGIGAGVVALAGAAFGHWYLTSHYGEGGFVRLMEGSTEARASTLPFLLGLAVGTVLLAFAVAFWFTRRRALQDGRTLWDGAARRLFWSLAVPLVVGGLFCIQLYVRGAAGLVVPAMLVFYGMALLNASKYTLDEIKLLAYTMLLLGLVASLLPNYAFLFFALGFGLGHIGYGLLMYNRYERAPRS